MSDTFDRTLTDPPRAELDATLVEAVACANNHETKKPIKWPAADLSKFTERLSSAPEGLHGWHGGTKPKYFGGRAQVIAIWWGDLLDRKHVRVLGGYGNTLCQRIGIDENGRRTPPILSTAELLFRDRIGRVQRATGAPALVAACDCGAVGGLPALGWVGPRCGPCHDQHLDGHALPKPLLIDTNTAAPPSFDFHPDGQSLVFSADGLWRYDCRAGTVEPVPCPADLSRGCNVTFTPDGKRLVLIDPGSGTTVFSVAVWEVGSPSAERWTHPRDSFLNPSYALSPDRETIAVATSTTRQEPGALRLHSIRDGSVRWSGPCAGAERLAFSPDGTRLVATDSFRPTRIWDVRSGRVESEFEQKIGVRAVTFSPDGALLYGISSDRAGHGWVTDLNGRVVRELDGSGNFYHALTFDPTGQVFLAGSGDHLSFWNPDAGAQRLDVTFNGWQLSSLAWAPNGRWLVTGGWGTIRFWPWPGIYEAAISAP